MWPIVPRVFCLAILVVRLLPVMAQAGEPLILKGHEDWVGGVAFARDGKTLATASADKTVRLWELPAGHLRLTLRGHSDAVSAVAFAPDGNSLASASFDAR